MKNDVPHEVPHDGVVVIVSLFTPLDKGDHTFGYIPVTGKKWKGMHTPQQVVYVAGQHM
jgi:hypothetical protein